MSYGVTNEKKKKEKREKKKINEIWGLVDDFIYEILGFWWVSPSGFYSATWKCSLFGLFVSGWTSGA